MRADINDAVAYQTHDIFGGKNAMRRSRSGNSPGGIQQVTECDVPLAAWKGAQYSAEFSVDTMTRRRVVPPFDVPVGMTGDSVGTGVGRVAEIPLAGDLADPQSQRIGQTAWRQQKAFQFVPPEFPIAANIRSGQKHGGGYAVGFERWLRVFEIIRVSVVKRQGDGAFQRHAGPSALDRVGKRHGHVVLPEDIEMLRKVRRADG